MLGREDDHIIGNRMREYLLNTLAEDTGILKAMREKANAEGAPLLMEETARLLEILVKLKNPVRILEAGTSIGYSSILMCQSSSGLTHIDTVELDYDIALKARQNIKDAGYSDKIHVIVGDIVDVFSNLQGSYDMIFMDAAKSVYLEVLPHCTRLLKEEGLLISDNVLYKGMILEPENKKHRTIIRNLREYLDVLCNEGTYSTSLVPVGDGVAISLKNKKEQVKI